MKETQLNQAQAIDVLIQAVRLAQAKGAFTLEDAELVSRAIKVFIPEKQVEPVSETETENVVAESVEPVLERVV
jgi:hypothetical protein